MGLWVVLLLMEARLIVDRFEWHWIGQFGVADLFVGVRRYVINAGRCVVALFKCGWGLICGRGCVLICIG